MQSSCTRNWQVVQRRLDLMTQEGIEFKTGVSIGTDVSAKQLMNQYDAMLLCMGSTWPRDLPIKGITRDNYACNDLSCRGAEGIHYALP